MNTNVFAQSIGMDRAQPLYDILNGKVKSISGALATRITHAHPDYNTQWLITGNGEMLSKPVTEKQVMDMAESTVAQLEKEIKLLYKLNDKLEKENARLEAELAEIKKAR